MNEPYTLDELKRRFQELGLDHMVSSIEFDNEYFDTMNVTINLQLIRQVDIKDTPEECFNRAMAILDA